MSLVDLSFKELASNNVNWLKESLYFALKFHIKSSQEIKQYILTL